MNIIFRRQGWYMGLEDEVTGRERTQGWGREVARGPQTLQASGKLSQLRFIGSLGAGPCTSLSAPLSLSPCWCTHTASQQDWSIVFFKSTRSGAWYDSSKRCRWRMRLVCIRCRLHAGAVVAGGVFVLSDFIRDLYKCLALWGRCRQTQEGTGRQVSFRLDETCSKPYISLALLSYWTLRLSSLHRSVEPTAERREREFGDVIDLCQQYCLCGWRWLSYCLLRRVCDV